MTRRHRRHSTARKREVVAHHEVCLKGESMRALSQKHDVCRRLTPIWIDKFERGEFDDDALEEEPLPEYEVRVVAPEQLVGRQAIKIGFPKGARRRAQSQRNAPASVITGPPAYRSDEGAGCDS